MCIFKKTYKIIDYNYNIVNLTAKQLYIRLLSDVRAGTYLFAPIAEIIKVCNNCYFPKFYSEKIKILILNYYSSYEYEKIDEYMKKGTEQMALYLCYNTLIGKDEAIVEAKRNYLENIVTSVTLYDKGEIEFPIHKSQKYYKLCNEWIKNKVEELSSKETIDFEKLRRYLYEDFKEMMSNAEKAISV